MPWVRMHACAQGSGRVSNGAVIVIKSLSINGVCVYAVCGFVGCVCAQVRKVSSGEVIVNEGDDGHEFYIIQKGACNCYKTLSQ
jgi:hypothetical protein